MISTPVEEEQRTNIGDTELLVSGILGGALAVYGLRRRDLLGLGLTALGGGVIVQGVTGRSPLYRAMGISLVRTTQGRQRVEVVKTLTINRPQEEIYRFWRNLENLPCFMRHLEPVNVLDEKRSHWTAKAPGGMTVEWDAEIINEEAYHLIAWRSPEGTDIEHWGIVRFTPAPGGRGTEVKVELEYEPVGGAFGTAVAELFGEAPAQQVEEDLRRFKQIMEAGEIPTTVGQPAGR
ncbi:MAG: cyclase [Nitrospiraceae bacterium]